MALDTKLQFPDLEKVGPGTPSGRYLRRFWHPVFRAQDLRRGQTKPIEVLGEKFTLYRGEDGASHVVAYRCAHRGVPLSLGWVEGDTLRCRYHGWRYDCSGQCVEQPNLEKPFAERVKIPVQPTKEYLGLIFAYLGEGEPPPFRHYPDFDTPGVIVADPIEVIPCSFWNRLDNDVAHIAWVHRATGIRKGRKDFIRLRVETVREAPYGYISHAPSRDESPSYKNTAHFFMPTTYQFWNRTRARGFENRNFGDTKITWTVPINDRKFAAFDVTHTPLVGKEAEIYHANRLEQQEMEAENRWNLAEKIIAGDMTPEDIPDEIGAYTSFEIEDYATQVGQGPVAERGREQLCETDAKLIMIRRLWLQEVTALLEGRPLTDWKIPTEPLVGEEMATGEEVPVA